MCVCTYINPFHLKCRICKICGHILLTLVVTPASLVACFVIPLLCGFVLSCYDEVVRRAEYDNPVNSFRDPSCTLKETILRPRTNKKRLSPEVNVN